MNRQIFKLALIASLAGFLFGFDTVVISGADKQLQALWNTTDLFHGTFIMSMALWGTVIGALFGGIPTDIFGRKKTLIGIGVLYFASSLGSGLAWDPYSFSFFRFIGGLGVGASTIAAPAYISEIAPTTHRGRLVAMYQLNIVFGILIAFLSNFLLQNFGAEPWRWMIGIEALPALIYLLGIFAVPNSPRWLLLKTGDLEKVNAIQAKLGNEPLRLETLSESKATEKAPLFSKRYRFPLILAFLVAFFNQLSGINAFLYYAPRIFEIAGLGSDSALLSSVGIGVTNLVFTLLGLYLIDRIGRKQLLLIGSLGYIVSLGCVGLAFLNEWQGSFVPGFLFVFIASHAIGQGAIIWVYISEIFPDQVRAQGQAFGCSTHWVLAALITLVMPVALAAFSNPAYIFFFFCGMMVLQLLFTIFIMPETKGISLDALSKKLKTVKNE